MMKNDDSYLIDIIEYSKLPPSKINMETFQGIIIYTILDKSIFPNNKHLKPFIKNVFDISFKEYVYNSRTLLMARIIREINKFKKDEIHILKVNFFKYFTKKENIETKGILSKWLEG